MRRALLAIVSVAAVVGAGCLAPQSAPEAPSPGPPSGPEVDLHAHTLDIAMPAHLPTALILLPISPDMWVHPFVGGLGLGVPRAPQQDSSTWALCPWMQSIGIPNGTSYLPMPYWLEPDGLKPAVRYMHLESNDAAGGRCATFMGTGLPAAAITAPQPRHGILALLVTARPDAGTLGNTTWQRDYVLRVGIGTKPCSDDPASAESRRFCPPPVAIPGEATLRAGPPVYAVHDTYTLGEACRGCGFNVTDQRQGVGPLSSGRIAFDRLSAVPGVSFAWAGAFGDGVSRIAAQLEAGGPPLHGSCTDAQGNAWVDLVAYHDGPARMQASFEVDGLFSRTQGPAMPGLQGGLIVSLLDIPIDLASEGLALESLQAPFMGSTASAGLDAC